MGETAPAKAVGDSVLLPYFLGIVLAFAALVMWVASLIDRWRQRRGTARHRPDQGL